MSPGVSVVIPVYNGERFLGRTLESILQQTVQDLEILVIDDGSTDQSVEVAQRFGDARIRIHSQVDRGLAASRNQGIVLASRPFIAFIDADDMWRPDKLFWQLEALERHPQCLAACSLSQDVDEGATIESAVEAAASDTASPPITAEDLYDKLLVGNFIGNGSSVLIRRELVDRIGYFDTRLKAAEDWDFYFRTAEVSPFALVHRPDVFYRIHSKSMSSAKVDVMEDTCRTVIRRIFRRAGPEHRHLLSVALAQLYEYLLRLLTRGGPPYAAATTLRIAWYVWRAEYWRGGEPLKLLYRVVRRLAGLLVKR